MPELPEVQTTVNDLRDSIIGHTITRVTVLSAQSIGHQSLDDFCRRLQGQVATRLKRRGKYMVFSLSSGEFLVVHLAMTGLVLLRRRDHEQDRFVRVVLELESGLELRIADSRKFGRLMILDSEEVTALNTRLGPEPLALEFEPTQLAQRLQRHRRPIKGLLMDQGFLAGIGNIYADEALFIAGIHPLRRASSLTCKEVERLHRGIRQALLSGIENHGTTIRSFLAPSGRPGRNQERLRVYHRQGRPCVHCGIAIRKTVVGGRSTHFCPSCQRLD